MRPHNSPPDLPVNQRRKPTHPKSTSALNEIRRLQETTTVLLPRAPFSRLVREILTNISNRDDLRVQSEALAALQESSEIYITQLMEDAYRCTLHRDRVTLQPKDMILARILRGASDPGNR